MKHVASILGFAIAGIFVMCVWGKMAGAYGLVGGWLAAFILISICWFMNHFIGVIDNPGAWVDMALGIALTGVFRDVFLQGASAALKAAPTLIIVCLGGIVGGVMAALVNQYLVEISAKASRDMAA